VRLHRFYVPALAVLALQRSVSLAAQIPILNLPRESQGASVSQTIGLTRISVSYHRPAVKGRKIWGALVPFDTVWRAGANENTILTVTSSFQIGASRLPAGRYGLHLVPAAAAWTMILSREANAWGSFSYTAKEDALRFQVTPRSAEFQEHLQYYFDDPTDSTVTLTLHWERLAGSFTLAIPTTEVVLDSVAHQLRDLPYFFGDAWVEAGRWALQHNAVAVAGVWADSALKRQVSFRNQRLKAAILERQGDAAAAAALRQQSMALATEPDINLLGYERLGAGKTDEAIQLFLRNTRDYPKSWNVWDSLAEAYATKGDKRQALANYQKALDMVQDETQKARIRAAMAGLRT
jgi:tetratricopeptide (TPR) repeat protein